MKVKLVHNLKDLDITSFVINLCQAFPVHDHVL